MNIPSITSIETALMVYYANSELGNKEITALFDQHSSATISKLKRISKDEMNKRDIPSYGMNKVNAAAAYEVWGIDVKDLEKRLKKMRELGLSL